MDTATNYKNTRRMPRNCPKSQKNNPKKGINIESIFSIYKNKVSPNYFTGTTALRFELALLNLEETQIENTVEKALEEVKVSQMKVTKEIQSNDSQALKRRKLLQI